MYKSGFDRNQLSLFPTSISDMIDKDSIVLVIDAFVDSLNMQAFDFKYSSPKSKGNRPYNPKDLLKLYLFGFNLKVRSSRSLMYLAKSNIEAIWLLNGLTPDHRTISDFRKDNLESLKKVFYEFNLSLKDLNYLSNINSQDGSKFKAVNSKDNNFTLNKIDDRLKKIKSHINNYFNMIDLNDDIDNRLEYIDDLKKMRELIDNFDSISLKDSSIDKDEYISKFKDYIDKLEFYKSLEDNIISSGKSQISLTDPESKLMRNNGKFDVCYNNQVLVDENNFVTDFQVTNKPADLGTITEISSNAKNIYDFDTMTNITDKGYNDRNDMMNALENGIIPEVTPSEGKDSFELTTDYVENNISDDMINSNKAEDIKACLKAGVIPNVYKDKITNIEVTEDIVYENNDNNNNDLEELSEQELRDKAINDYCFTRDIKSNKVFCPMGETLRQKSNGKAGCRYWNKLACQNCKNPCCNLKYKTVDFKEGKTIVVPKNSNITKSRTSNNKKKKKIKRVHITIKSNNDLLKKRMTLSELPHAHLKRLKDASYVLLKGMEKVTGEFSIYYCSSNILHAKNLIGVDKLVEYFKNKPENILKIAE